ncbi:cation:proton antiporter domain-containing protein [Litchfieldia salsa]|uniref:Kef-type K+ transport system, membrane component KefB n=1 Tax=Litchfieldia salsa TaxID=930152 RepID=A0A1H0RW59_9BACI|nr:cation:proton antiporter [Litchfieldia salsa]SDP33198.1 Kef-type K+ transport system, membrane component KefB [Litchfieldia salsa]
MFELPLTNPVIVFALSMTVFLISPMLMRLLKIPGIIGPIIAGVVIGPHGLGVLQRGQTIELLGTVGLLFIIFIAGLEMDIDGFKKYRNRSITFGLLSFFIPLILGTGIGLFLEYSLAASILLGSILGSHTLLGYPIASRLGISKNKAVTTAVGGTLLTDTLALLILAVITGAATGDLSIAFFVTLIISLTIFTILNLIGIPILSKWIFKNMGNEGDKVFTYVIVVLFLSAFLAILAGVEPIIGAFLSGLALNRLVFDQGPLMNRIRFTANALFIPFFLLSVGMLMDLGVLISDPKAWILTILILVGVMIGKYAAAWITSKIYKYSNEERNITFGLTIPQAAATLAATLVGFDVGLLDQSTVNGVIIMILGTCIVGPYLVEKFGREISLHEEQQPYEKGDAPERIMIPMANPDTMESLLDLGFVLRKNTSMDQPLYPLRIVKKDMRTAEGEIANAEKMLGHTVMYASGADVPVKLVTRVDHNIANGIARAIVEERISMVIVGWEGKRSTPQRIFGNVLDQLVEQTSQSIIIAKLKHPLSTTKRIIAILPKGIDHSRGFKEALMQIKMMTNDLGAQLVCIVIDDEASKYEKFLKEIKSNPVTSVKEVEDWDTLYFEPSPQRNDDLIIVVSARKGTVAWHPELEIIPGKLAAMNHETFIIYYPQEEKEIDVRGTTGTELPKEVLFKNDFY